MQNFPGPNAIQILKDAQEFYATSTNDSRAFIEIGNGPYVWDVDGNKYIDMHCGAGVANLGHNHAPSMQIIINHLQKTGIVHTEHHNAFNPAAIELAKFLAMNTPVPKPAKVFLSNSGAEANVAAIKACQAYRFHQGERQARCKAIYFENGFAGRMLGLLAGTSSNPAAQRDPYWTHCDQENTIYLPYPTKANHNLLKKRIAEISLDEVDYLLIEIPCQGEAGIIPSDEEALKYVYKITTEAGILWIADSIQCGIGRVGTLWGCDIYPWLKPDILTLAKALGGGLPIGATIFSSYLDWKKGEHSNTFGGNPLISRLALTVLACVQKLLEKGAVNTIEMAMRKRLHILRQHPMVQDTRGMGAMWAVELADAKLRDRLIDICEEMALTDCCGIKLLGAGKTSVRLMPPLTISPKDLRLALDLFLTALNKLADEQVSLSNM
ncbi:MAG: aspartate aminotransferase family protein [Candidatus Sungbacteria bacterium]|nr:aspartate aminotransferase family protein [bacterium]MDZ4260604.1 aspartate aminotransferase family protein [Candidatus Sungbacteria bacterium]